MPPSVLARYVGVINDVVVVGGVVLLGFACVMFCPCAGGTVSPRLAGGVLTTAVAEDVDVVGRLFMVLLWKFDFVDVDFGSRVARICAAMIGTVLGCALV